MFQLSRDLWIDIISEVFVSAKLQLLNFNCNLGAVTSFHCCLLSIIIKRQIYQHGSFNGS